MSLKLNLVKIIVFSLLLWLLLAAISIPTAAITSLDEVIYATIEGASPETVDPACCYDTASGELISNVYETLVFFDGERVDMYIPQLATEWTTENITGTTSPEGLPWHFRYVFKIRTNVHFHNTSYVLTPEDVEYSFERAMVQDWVGGPQWMFYEPLLNAWSAWDLGNLSDPLDVVKIGKMIDHAVESNGTCVWFNLAFQGAYAQFMQILTQTWSSISSKGWIKDYVIGALSRPDWNGEWGDYTAWINYHNPTESPLDKPIPIMCGTGPYQLETLDFSNNYWSIVRFADYWRGWPADWPAPPYPSVPGTHLRPAGYINRCNVTWAYTWDERREMFLAGEIDFCAVPAKYIGQVLGKPGIRAFTKLPGLLIMAMFFTINISQISPFLGVPGGLPFGTFNESGIPPNFFSDVHVRKAFAYSFNYTLLNELNYHGEELKLATWCPAGIPYWNPDQEGYDIDLVKAEEEFRLAWDGQVWENGFKVTIVIPVSSSAANWNFYNILKTNIESLNPKFHIDKAELIWWDYYERLQNGEAPVFSIGWGGDYPDPDNFVRPFMHSSYCFAYWQRYGNEIIDNLIEEGIRTLNTTKRREIYNELQRIYHEDCPNVPLHQSAILHFEREWIKGWYHNLAYPGLYFYPLWKKQEILQGDINFDNIIDTKDIAYVCRAYGSYYGPPIHPQWNFRCDLNNDRIVETKDVAIACKNYGGHP